MVYARHIYHVYAVRTPARERLIESLAGKGIVCGVHYPVPIHLQRAYASRGERKGRFPVAEQCAEDFVSLPMYPELTEEQILYVSNQLADSLLKKEG
jgi:dTDP-4-amino-4,6-dideoxygalactose transaminase